MFAFNTFTLKFSLHNTITIAVFCTPKSKYGSLIKPNCRDDTIIERVFDYMEKQNYKFDFNYIKEHNVMLDDIYRSYTHVQFYNEIHNHKINFHFNISLPEQIDRIRHILPSIHSIIFEDNFSNFDKILPYFNKPLTFIGFAPNTYSNIDKNILKYFNKFVFVNNQLPKLNKEKSFDNYESFNNYAISVNKNFKYTLPKLI